MANALYPKWKEALTENAANSDIMSGDVKVALIDTNDYTYSASHEFLDDVPAGAIVATSGNLTNKTNANGVFDADDVTLSNVSGDESEALIIYVDTGNPATSRLVAYIDTGVTGLPVTPNGGNIIIAWNASGIFALPPRPTRAQFVRGASKR